MSTLGLLLLLAVVQGLTEYLPVSSSGHLVLARELLPGGEELPQDASVEVVLHLGTLLAVLGFYRREVGRLLLGLLGKGEAPSSQRRLAALLVVGTLPAGLVGLFLQEPIESLFASAVPAAVCLLATGTLLWWSKGLTAGAGLAHQLTTGSALLIGIAQACAILPGISRSGATIVAGMALGLHGSAAAAFSFLLSIPAILGAAVLKLPEALEAESAVAVSELAWATLVSFFVGCLALGMLLWLVRARRLAWFAPYCWLVGGIALAAVTLT